MSDCEVKKTIRSEEDKRSLISRLNRIEGQVRGITSMVMDDRYCDDILIQLAAIDKSIKSLSNVLLEKHIKSCVVQNIKNGNEEILDELIQFYKRFQ